MLRYICFVLLLFEQIELTTTPVDESARGHGASLAGIFLDNSFCYFLQWYILVTIYHEIAI
jgi:hypothetical protein